MSVDSVVDQRADRLGHGTLARYKRAGCRCVECRYANLAQGRRQRLRTAQAHWSGAEVAMVPVCGTRRRLQALAVLGWSTRELARRLGVAQGVITALGARTEHVHPATAARVARLYDALWDHSPTLDGYTQRVQRHARRRGWLPPMAWDDDTIDDPAAVANLSAPAPFDWVRVDRALAGQPERLTGTERRAVVAHLTAHGASAADIAELLHLSERTIVRDRQIPTIHHDPDNVIMLAFNECTKKRLRERIWQCPHVDDPAARWRSAPPKAAARRPRPCSAWPRPCPTRA